MRSPLNHTYQSFFDSKNMEKVDELSSVDLLPSFLGYRLGYSLNFKKQKSSKQLV